MIQACSLVFPVTPQDGVIWHFGDDLYGAWMGIRNSSSIPILRVRAGGGGLISRDSNNSDIAYVDVMNFPRDGGVHDIVVEIGLAPLKVHPPLSRFTLIRTLTHCT